MKQLLLILSIFLLPIGINAKESPCMKSAKYRLLDFWIGEWDVYVGTQKVGVNRIEPVLNSCAMMENWKDERGGEGKSWFYYDLLTSRWKQVWVTDEGYMKEKVQQDTQDSNTVMFQGTVASRSGGTVLDRTTLIKQGSELRQIIEISNDSGKTWKAVFDSVHRLRK